MKNFDLSQLLKNSSSIPFKQQIKFVLQLSVPGMLAQISSILMQYIDAAMVGAMGAQASAAIGLVASSTWVIGSLAHAMCVGFYVQVAHLVGAGEKEKAKNVFFQSIIVCLFYSLVLAGISFSICFELPKWLGAPENLVHDSSMYFLVFGLSTPFFEIVYLMSGMLQSTGNMKFPAAMNAVMCLLDIAFNWLFIFVLKLGVKGAAFGSAAAAFVTALIMLTYTLFFSGYLNLRNFKNFSMSRNCVFKAIKIAAPVGLESSAFSGALVIVAKIIAPLGAVAIAANSFATTAESLCYMPGYGVQEAASTLVGQSYGAKRNDLSKSFSAITITAGILIMSLAGVAMYFLCPVVFQFLTPDKEIQNLSAKILRIELFAEPLFAASIVSTGILRGKGDTLVPSILNLFSLWIVRLGLSILLVKPFGLPGIWFAMAIELCFRGIIMLLRVFFSMNKKITLVK